MTAAAFGRVAVLMGGTSGERAISLHSGAAVLAGLQQAGVDAFGLDLGEQPVQQILAASFDRAFIALHGRGGEDGSVQGLLDLLAKPYTGSGVLASALAMNKVQSKLLWQGLGIPTPAFMQLEAGMSADAIVNTLGLPLIIKPVHEGSSLGVHRVTEPHQLQAAWSDAASHDALVMAERLIEGGEYTVAILNGEALPPIKMETDREFYDYEAKYQRDDTRYLIPCGLSADAIDALQTLALDAFHSLGCRGWGRVDFMLDGDGKPWVLEVNTVPGMTDHSLVPMAARAQGMTLSALVCAILEAARYG